MLKQTKLVDEEEVTICNSITLSEANPLAFKVITLIDKHLENVEVVGSVRRQKKVVKDIDLIGTGNLKGATDNLVYMLDGKVIMKGDKIVRLLIPFIRGHVQIDIYGTTEENHGIMKLIRTGSAEHNIWLARHAIKHGLGLRYSQGVVKDGKVIAGRDEKEVFAALSLEYINPTEREIVNRKPVWLK